MRPLFSTTLSPSRALTGNQPNVADVQPGGIIQELVADGGEDLFAVIHRAHLVHGHNEMLYAEQLGDESVAAGLLQHSVAHVDQHDRKVRAGCPGRHVPGVLLRAGRVGDNELPLGGRNFRLATSMVMPCSLSALRPSSKGARSGASETS